MSTTVPESWQTKGLTITRGGNVGVGTASPSDKLQVDGTVRSKRLLTPAGDITLSFPTRDTYLDISVGSVGSLLETPYDGSDFLTLHPDNAPPDMSVSSWTSVRFMWTGRVLGGIQGRSYSIDLTVCALNEGVWVAVPPVIANRMYSGSGSNRMFFSQSFSMVDTGGKPLGLRVNSIVDTQGGSTAALTFRLGKTYAYVS